MNIPTPQRWIFLQNYGEKYVLYFFYDLHVELKDCDVRHFGIIKLKCGKEPKTGQTTHEKIASDTAN